MGQGGGGVQPRPTQLRGIRGLRGHWVGATAVLNHGAGFPELGTAATGS